MDDSTVDSGVDSTVEPTVWSQVTAETLSMLPTRRPVDDPEPSAEVRWERIDTDRYRIVAGGRAIGFVDIVGAVFVALEGLRYDRATEVVQTLDFDLAVSRLREAAGVGDDGRDPWRSGH